MTQGLRSWTYPANLGSFDIPSGVTNIDLSPSLLNRYRNLSVEILLSGVTSSDVNLNIDFFRANSNAAFSAPNIESVGNTINVTSELANNSTLVFIRDFKNIDNSFLRAVVNAPSGVTAQMVINVTAGGQVT